MSKNKTNVYELNIFSGIPTFRNKLFLGTPNISNSSYFYEMIKDIFQRKWLTNNGQYVKQFEAMIQEYLGVRNAIAVNNGTTGLQIAFRAMDLKGEVIVPSYTFIATVHSLFWLGINPVFCDIDPRTFNIDINKAEKLINKKINGIVAVDVYGRPSEKDKLESLATEYDVPLIFDAAHAFGNSFHGKMIGNFGDAEVFSFHATKFLNTFEGGVITTDDDELATKIRAMRNFGFLDDHTSRFLGTNGKMTEISAAMGIVNLQNIDRIIEINKANYNAYKEGLKNIPGIRLIEYSDLERNNYQYVIIEVIPEECGLTRDELTVVLDTEGIGTRKYFWPACHQMEPYSSLYPNAGSALHISEIIASRVLALPTGTSVSTEDVFSICNVIRLSIFGASKVKDQLRKVSFKADSV